MLPYSKMKPTFYAFAAQESGFHLLLWKDFLQTILWVVMLARCPALAMSLVGQIFLFIENIQLIGAIVHEVNTFSARHDR